MQETKWYPQIFEGVAHGGYVLADDSQKSNLNLILIATDSEVHLPFAALWLAIEAGVTLGWNSYLGPKIRTLCHSKK